MNTNKPIIQAQDVYFYYGSFQALIDIRTDIQPRKVTALIGPSGCGKSTYLRCLNRMNDTIANTRLTGNIFLDGEDIYAPDVDLTALRQRVGMVFPETQSFSAIDL